MTPSRAAEIIAAYGADAARWPAAERSATLAALEADPALRADCAAAERLDLLLGDWAMAPIAPGNPREAARSALAAARPPARAGVPRWLGVGALAATVAAAVFLAPSTIETSEPAPQPAAIAAATPRTVAHDPAADAQVFAMLFTPTPEEELYL